MSKQQARLTWNASLGNGSSCMVLGGKDVAARPLYLEGADKQGSRSLKAWRHQGELDRGRGKPGMRSLGPRPARSATTEWRLWVSVWKPEL